MDVETILRAKGTAIYSVTPESPVSEAVKLMHERRIGAVLVMDENADEVQGILSERDIIRMVAEHGCTALAGAVAQFMTRELVACTADCTTDTVFNGMGKHNVRHLPVYKDDKLYGVVSSRDVMQYRIRQLESGGEPRFQHWFPKGRVYAIGG